MRRKSISSWSNYSVEWNALTVSLVYVKIYQGKIVYKFLITVGSGDTRYWTANWRRSFMSRKMTGHKITLASWLFPALWTHHIHACRYFILYSMFTPRWFSLWRYFVYLSILTRKIMNSILIYSIFTKIFWDKYNLFELKLQGPLIIFSTKMQILWYKYYIYLW